MNRDDGSQVSHANHLISLFGCDSDISLVSGFNLIQGVASFANAWLCWILKLSGVDAPRLARCFFFFIYWLGRRENWHLKLWRYLMNPWPSRGSQKVNSEMTIRWAPKFFPSRLCGLRAVENRLVRCQKALVLRSFWQRLPTQGEKRRVNLDANKAC